MNPQSYPYSADPDNPLNQLNFLLTPLFEAGWQALELGEASTQERKDRREYNCVSCYLRRSCLLIKATYFPGEDMVWFEPASVT